MIKLIVWLKNAQNQFLRPLTLNNFFCRCGIDGDFLHLFYNGIPNIRTNFQLYANYSNLECVRTVSREMGLSKSSVQKVLAEASVPLYTGTTSSARGLSN
jgi:hypothetical protein